MVALNDKFSNSSHTHFRPLVHTPSHISHRRNMCYCDGDGGHGSCCESNEKSQEVGGRPPRWVCSDLQHGNSRYGTLVPTLPSSNRRRGGRGGGVHLPYTLCLRLDVWHMLTCEVGAQEWRRICPVRLLRSMDQYNWTHQTLHSIGLLEITRVS